MAVPQRPAKMAPSAYMTGTTTPVAMTASWRTVPTASAQPNRGRPTTPARMTAAAARKPPTRPAVPGRAWAMVIATGIDRPMTMASMISTVEHSRLIRTASRVVQGAARRRVRAQQHAGLASGHDRAGDQHAGGARVVARGLVGQPDGGVDGLV